jgi:hypothetical protein
VYQEKTTDLPQVTDKPKLTTTSFISQVIEHEKDPDIWHWYHLCELKKKNNQYIILSKPYILSKVGVGDL